MQFYHRISIFSTETSDLRRDLPENMHKILLNDQLMPIQLKIVEFFLHLIWYKYCLWWRFFVTKNYICKIWKSLNYISYMIYKIWFWKHHKVQTKTCQWKSCFRKIGTIFFRNNFLIYFLIINHYRNTSTCKTSLYCS